MQSIETLGPREQDHLHAAVSIETPEESVLKDSNYRGSRKASQRLIPFIYPTSFCARDEEHRAGIMLLESHAALRLLKHAHEAQPTRRESKEQKDKHFIM